MQLQPDHLSAGSGRAVPGTGPATSGMRWTNGTLVQTYGARVPFVQSAREQMLGEELADQLATAVDADLGEDRLDVIAHGVRGDVQLVGDLLGGVAACQPEHDLQLAVGELVPLEQDRQQL